MPRSPPRLRTGFRQGSRLGPGKSRTRNRRTTLRSLPHLKLGALPKGPQVPGRCARSCFAQVVVLVLGRAGRECLIPSVRRRIRTPLGRREAPTGVTRTIFNKPELLEPRGSQNIFTYVSGVSTRHRL